MPTAKQAVGIIIPIFLVALLASFLFPVVIGAMSGAEEATHNQSVGETMELQPGLNATLDSVDTTADSATYTINASGDTATATVDNGTNSTVTVDGADVTIGVENVETDSATATFDYPRDYGWGGAASSLWVILPLLIVLALFLYVVGMATDYL